MLILTFLDPLVVAIGADIRTHVHDHFQEVQVILNKFSLTSY